MDEHFANLDAWTLWEGNIFDATVVKAANVSLIAGGVRLTGLKEPLIGGKYQGAMIETVATYRYGYFECRGKVPPGVGLWPGFWLEDQVLHNPEIDIMEYVGANTMYCTNWLDGTSEQASLVTNDLSRYTHTFAAKWTADAVEFFWDGWMYATISTHVPQAAIHVAADMFVGGSWAGDPDVNTVFPAQFDIEYIKVWQKA